MQILPIDFVLDDRELTQWHDAWSVERYGKECLNPERYYKNYADGDRFATDGTPKEGDENILDEKAEQDRVLELLLRIRKLTRELKGLGASKLLSSQERKQKREEREMLYREYIEITQGGTATNKAATGHEQETEREKEYFSRAIMAGFMEKTCNGYRWLFGGNRGQARLGYFCHKVYSQPRPINRLEKLFNVSKLSASITNAGFEAKRELVSSLPLAVFARCSAIKKYSDRIRKRRY